MEILAGGSDEARKYDFIEPLVCMHVCNRLGIRGPETTVRADIASLDKLVKEIGAYIKVRTIPKSRVKEILGAYSRYVPGINKVISEMDEKEDTLAGAVEVNYKKLTGTVLLERAALENVFLRGMH